MEYHDFDLEFTKDNNDVETPYKVEVVRSMAGEKAWHKFQLPFDATSKENHLLKIEKAVRHLTTKNAAGRKSFNAEDRVDVFSLAKDFGGGLYASVFKDDVATKLAESIRLAEEAKALLRIRLRFTKAEELASLPWEQLYDSSRWHFLGVNFKHVSIVRYIENQQPISALKVALPLRVLVVISREGEVLGYEEELSNLRRAVSRLDEGMIELDLLDNVTHEELNNKLGSKDFHVLHYIGHGGFDPATQQGFLSFHEQKVYGENLGMTLAHRGTVRLAIINACEGGRAAMDGTYAGVAQSLIQHNIPAVVAMQFEVSDEAAIKFADKFYYSIATGETVETALSEARMALHAWDSKRGEWATPVLYTRADNGKLFDLPPKALNFKTPEKEFLEIELPTSPPSSVISCASRFYVKRNIDERLEALLTKSTEGVTISISAGGQAGKSSLLKSAVIAAEHCRKRTAYVNCQSDFDSKHLASVARFHRHFCRVLADKLGLPDRLDAHWKLHDLSVSQRCTRYVDYLLQMLHPQQIVLILDDVDRLAEPEIQSGFLKMLRSWRDGPENFERMDIVWANAIGMRSFFPSTLLSFEDFSEEEIQALGQRYGVSVNEGKSEKLKKLLGGSPFLLHLAFYETASNQNRDIGNLINELSSNDPPSDTGLFGPDLMSKYSLLRQNQKLRGGMIFISKNIHNGWATISLDAEIDEQALWQLYQSGLIIREGNRVRFRCQLYENYFKPQLEKLEPNK